MQQTHNLAKRVIIGVMRVLRRNKRTSSFVPDFMARSLREVDFRQLQQNGIKYIAFDADSTLVNFRGRVIDPQTRQFLLKQRPLFRDWCIATNRFTHDLQPLGKSINAPVIQASIIMRKPHRNFFNHVIKHFDCQPGEIAMIGDKLLADIWGAKRIGMKTVWVEKIGHDSPWDWLLRTRYFEKRILGRYIKV